MAKGDQASLLETLAEGELAQTIGQNPKSTLEPPRLGSDAASRALDALESSPEIGVGLELGVTIGEGGMGIVRTATQLSLGRRVAVKTLRAEGRSDEAKLRLLREGWITGSLEHPNIVPVHDLGLDADGTPIIVLKHIEGLAWSELIRDAAAVEARFGAGDLLEYNLRILAQLCSAVSLAHARGILHRDLKPANVMVGRFGEVYLVDWGLAVSLRPDPSGRLPLASDVKDPAGTPAYMAPEMLGEGGVLGERTDVYQLGAMLYEILMGRAPHEGAGFRPIVASILASAPEFDADVPPELAAIVTRAMRRSAEDRYASATELRERIEWYLRHRGSLALSAAAMGRVGELRQLLAGGGEADDLRDRVHHLFAEARFGFRQAIRACDDNTGARIGLREITEMVVVFELERGAVEAAAAALAELEEGPPELTARVVAALQRRDLERARVADLEKLHADLDPMVGRRARLLTVIAVSLCWIVLPETLGWMYARNPNPPRWFPYLHTSSMLAFVLAVFWLGRATLAKSALNRFSQAAVLMMCAMQLTLEVGGNVLGLPYAQLLPLHMFGWCCASTAFSFLVERRLMPATFGFLAGFLGACLKPEYVFHAMSLTAVVFVGNAFFLWSRPSEDASFVVRHVRKRLDPTSLREE